MAAVLVRPRQLSLPGKFRAVSRLVCMAAMLLLCLPLYYLNRLLHLPNPWPRIFLGGVAWIAGVALSHRGNKAKGGVLLVANHVSWIDIPALTAATGSAFVGHDGLAAIPLIEWLCRMNRTVFIARHDRTSVAEQIETVRAALSHSGALTIFPEGTTSDGTGLLPFKTSLLSAFEPLPEGIAVQPVLLDYGLEAADIAWVGEEHGFDNFLRILARTKPVQLTIHYLPVLSGFALANRKTIAAAAREAIGRALAA